MRRGIPHRFPRSATAVRDDARVVTVIVAGLGTLLVLAAFADMGATLLHPSRRGPLSWPLSIRLFWLTHAVAARRRSAVLLSFAGPLAMLAHLAVWATAAWAGFALVYWPWLAPDGGSVAARTHDALYLSGTALTTVGFGDIIGPNPTLALVTTLEAAAGLATLSASISFLLSVYPLISRMRRTAALLEDHGAAGSTGARLFVVTAGRSELAQLHRDLIDMQQDLKRFPVLALFRPTRSREALTTLLDGLAWICLHACWGPVAEPEAESVRFHGQALRRATEALMAELAVHLVHSAPPAEPATDAAEFAARCDGFLRALAQAHLEEHRPVRWAPAS
jgi:hypothetical protein